MSLSVTIQQASCNALASYIASKLTDVTVFARWPEANVQLPSKAISIIPAGQRITEFLDNNVLFQSSTTDPNPTYAWQIASCRQPIQLDVWATADVLRDDILARLDNVLNAGFSTIGAGANSDPARDGVVLALADGWSPSITDYLFDAPFPNDTPDSVQRSEYRATFRGNAYMKLYKTATSPRLARILLKQRLHETDKAPAGELYDTIIITN